MKGCGGGGERGRGCQQLHVGHVAVHFRGNIHSDDTVAVDLTNSIPHYLEKVQGFTRC